MVELREYSLSQWRSYLEGYKSADIKCVFLHHTYIPDARAWNGMSSMLAIRRAHINRGGRDIFCHCYTTPQGTIYNGRPPDTSNCACQAPPENFNIRTFPSELRDLILNDYPYSKYGSGPAWRRLARAWPNKHGFSIETVGNFQKEDPRTSTAMHTSIEVISMVCDIWNIPSSRIFFHREISSTSCPGSNVSKAWVKNRVKEVSAVPDISEWAEYDVELIKERGIMSGFPDGTFRGREPMTREQCAAALNRAIDYVMERIENGNA